MYAQKKHTSCKNIIRVNDYTFLPATQLRSSVIPGDPVQTAYNFVHEYLKCTNGNIPDEYTSFVGISPKLPMWEIHDQIRKRDYTESSALIIWSTLTNPEECMLLETNSFTIDCIRAYLSMIQARNLHPEERWQRAYTDIETDELRIIMEIGKLYPIPTKYHGKDLYPDSSDSKFIGIALQQAIYELLYAKNTAEGISRITSRGGNVYINCAVYYFLVNN